MFGARRYCCATAGLLAALAFPVPTSGNEAPSTSVLVTSTTSDARVTRALVLIRGELSALGLEVQVRGADDPSSITPSITPDRPSDRLVLEVKDGVIAVRVFAAGTQTPLLESVDLDGPQVTAEVIAVRAVEALRAARLLPAPTRQAPPNPPPAASAASAEPAPLAPSAAEPETAASSARPTSLLQFALGPTFVQNLQGLPQLSAHVALSVGPRWGFVSIGAEGSLTGLDFERESGAAQISRRTMFLQLGARARLHRVWEVNARAGFSYLHYAANGVARPAYAAQDLEHGSAGLCLSLGGAYYFARALGVYFDLGGSVAFDAASVRLADESVVTLDRPSFAFGSGLLLGAF